MTNSTGELMTALKNEQKSVENYLNENKDELISINIKKMWSEFVKKSGISKTEIIDRSDCGYNYFYCIINGKKIPSRDKIIQLVIAMGLTIDDCQTALKYCGRSPLYPRVKRDSIIIFGIKNGQSIYQISNALVNNGEKSLLGNGKSNE